MKKVILGLALLVVFLAPAVQAAPQPLNDEQIEQIRRNCRGSKSILQQIQRNDAAARINRGRVYESVGKLLTNFNSRIVLNKVDAPNLVSAASSFSSQVTVFQTDYLAYEDVLSATLKTNCQEQPVTFYDTLTRARELRTKVNRDIQNIDAHLETYQQGITELRATLVEAEKLEDER